MQTATITKMYLTPRMLVVLLLGFSSGLPLALVGGTLQARMKAEGIDLSVLGATSLITFPYAIKFLWSPLFDRFRLPFLGGGRRAWIILCQALLTAGILALGSVSPAQSLTLTAGLATLVAFFSASQDIVIDGFRTEMLEPHERGPGAAMAVLGYRLGMLLASSGALILSDLASWQVVYGIMAASLGIGVLATLFAPEQVEPIVAAERKTLTFAVLEPLRAFLQERGAVSLLIFIATYKLGDVFAGQLSTVFMLDLGFSRSDIGMLSKGVGLIATIAGGLVGGGIVVKLGLRRSLVVCGIIQAVTIGCFWLLARVGHHYPTLVLAIVGENFGSGLGNAPLTALLMTLCSRGLAATQYALLSSVTSLSRVLLASFCGAIASWLGWQWYFVFCIALAGPSFVLLWKWGGQWKGLEPEEVG